MESLPGEIFAAALGKKPLSDFDDRLRSLGFSVEATAIRWDGTGRQPKVVRKVIAAYERQLSFQQWRENKDAESVVFRAEWQAERLIKLLPWITQKVRTDGWQEEYWDSLLSNGMQRQGNQLVTPDHLKAVQPLQDAVRKLFAALAQRQVVEPRMAERAERERAKREGEQQARETAERQAAERQATERAAAQREMGNRPTSGGGWAAPRRRPRPRPK